MERFTDYETFIAPTITKKFSSDIFDTWHLRRELPTTYQNLIQQLYYARFISEENRREIWSESVMRFMNYIYERCEELGYTLSDSEFLELYQGIIDLKVLPSMRLLWCAGEAVRNNAVSSFNCAFSGIKDVRAFSDILFLGMSGTGVGFSVEEQYISQLPEVKPIFSRDQLTVTVEDSREGWSDAFRHFLQYLYEGVSPIVDFSYIRPAGLRLKTAGGFSSGPDCLKVLFNYVRKVFDAAQGRKLTALECHDIVCKTAEAAVAGGTRRSALISFSDLDNEQMRTAKAGSWYEEAVHRTYANNSAVYQEKPSWEVFNREWENLVASRSGERGIFNEYAVLRKIRQIGRRNPDITYRSNPCSEISLQHRQFCNLSNVNIYADDDLNTVSSKVRLATILGTIQSTVTDFHYLDNEWKQNTESERLLGVSLSGIADHPFFFPSDTFNYDKLAKTLAYLKYIAVDTNKTWAKKLDIPISAAITTVKPSGDSSQLSGTSSGIHPSFAPYYLRRIRMSVHDPIAQQLADNGMKYEIDITNSSVMIFAFPQKAPSKIGVFGNNLHPAHHLKIWLQYAKYWSEHMVSATLMIHSEEQWSLMGNEVWKNFEDVCGLSFLPYDDHVYPQAPYEPIEKSEYHEILKQIPHIDFRQFKEYDDNTSSPMACTGNTCEIKSL